MPGLAVARALAKEGIDVHAVSRWPEEVGRCSRRIRLIDVHGKLAPGPEALCEWLADYAKELGNRPVVFPVSDQVVLELARHRERLSALCRIWNNDHDKATLKDSTGEIISEYEY